MVMMRLRGERNRVEKSPNRLYLRRQPLALLTTEFLFHIFPFGQTVRPLMDLSLHKSDLFGNKTSSVPYY